MFEKVLPVNRTAVAGFRVFTCYKLIISFIAELAHGLPEPGRQSLHSLNVGKPSI